MSKSLKIIITGLLLVCLLAFLGWSLLVEKSPLTPEEAPVNTLPFGAGSDVDLTPGQVGAPPTTDEGFGVSGGKPVEKLFRISDSPVAGFVLLEEATTTVRYVDRATGHIYDVSLYTLENTRVTNVTIPKVYEAIFRADGSKVVYRSLGEDDVADTTSITLSPPVGTSTLLYTPLATIVRGDISEIIAGAGDTLYYVLRDTEAVVTSAFNGTGQRTLLSSPFTSWRLSLAGNALLVWSKASSAVSGHAYTLNTSNGSLGKLLGPLNGLTLSASGSGLAYSYNEAGRTVLKAREGLNGPDFEIYPSTLAEKCALGSREARFIYCAIPSKGVGAGEPDNWYRGVSHYSDNIWRFDIRVDISEILSEPEKALSVSIDVYQPKLSPREDYLVFINKSDLSLWALKLGEE